MDTSTHVMMGFGLAALSQIDPAISQNEALTQAVLIGTILGSNAPDFDILYKLRGYSSYVKNHRSYSHCIPILPFWALLITFTINLFIPGTSFFHVFLWTFLGVILHVVTDLFNVHGTKALLPLDKSRISFDTIPLFDSFITVLHLVGFILCIFFSPGLVFVVIYAAISLYISLRFSYQIWIKKQLKDHFQQAERIKLIPKNSILKWGVFIETNEDFLFGTYCLNAFEVEHVSNKKIEHIDLIDRSTSHPIVNDFLASTNYAHPFVEKKKNGYFIFWKDLRFRHNKFFPCSSIIYLSSDGKKIYSVYSGWLYSLKQLRKEMKKLKKAAFENQ